MANATVSFLGKTNDAGDANALFLKVYKMPRSVGIHF